MHVSISLYCTDDVDELPVPTTTGVVLLGNTRTQKYDDGSGKKWIAFADLFPSSGDGMAYWRLDTKYYARISDVAANRCFVFITGKASEVTRF